MGWCKVGGGDGAKAVADMLMYNGSIRRLDLRGNGFGNDGERLPGSTCFVGWAGWPPGPARQRVWLRW